MSTTTVATLATTITTARWPHHVIAVNEPNVNILGPITSWPGTGITSSFAYVVTSAPEFTLIPGYHLC